MPLRRTGGKARILAYMNLFRCSKKPLRALESGGARSGSSCTRGDECGTSLNYRARDLDHQGGNLGHYSANEFANELLTIPQYRTILHIRIVTETGYCIVSGNTPQYLCYRTFNPGVMGSIPIRPTIFRYKNKAPSRFGASSYR